MAKRGIKPKGLKDGKIQICGVGVLLVDLYNAVAARGGHEKVTTCLIVLSAYTALRPA
jgi:hypothetical protein